MPVHPRWPHWRRLLAAVVACLVAAGAATAATLIIGHGARAGDAASHKTVPLGTTLVVRTDLVSREQYQGQLTYTAGETVHPDGAGTVTSLPAVGQILSRGSAAWAIDDQPIGVLFGSTPLFRTLVVSNPSATALAVQGAEADLLAAQAAQPRAGGTPSPASAARDAQARVAVAEARRRVGNAERALRQSQAAERGPDVALVADNMIALGYVDADSDGPIETWGPDLQAAVQRWQLHLGATGVDGEITPGDALVVPGPERVGAVQGRVGDPASAVTVSLTSSQRVATFQVHDGVPPELGVGRRVRLSAAGRSAVERVASVTSGHGSATVVVDLSRSSPLAGLTSTRVTLSVTTSDQRDILVVPVQALVALASGGYALQLPSGRLLAVHTGGEQNESIEVSGVGIRAGLRVVTVT